ncbi:MAG TPA: M20 family metallopeptidase [Saprospiraceae bacterium]|nr:M20 family metallopeptidase [Saprospiraceae bacterium]HNT19137.1 M20 family metallopeptidase [Saprospiraceae bacterium]
MLVNDIKREAKKIHKNVVLYRRHLHAHPELSFLERETSGYVKARLDELGIPWEAMAGTGVVGMIRGESPGDGGPDRVVALRADMDALPITETNTFDFISQNPGVMHACGHDAHTSSLLGTAQILQSVRKKFSGTVKLIFQPGEEKLPGGASMMIRDGVLENPKPRAVIGQHVMPSLECGKIGFRAGKHMASMDQIIMRIGGKGGHGAQPHQNIDPVIITAHILVALQQIVSRMANPSIPTVLSFGKVIANGAINVIPDEVYVEGTFRTFDEKWRADAHHRMTKMAEHLAVSMGGTCEMEITRGYPFLVNEEKLTSQLRTFTEDYLGRDKVVDMDLWMAAEDFAYYSQATDACFYLLGVGNPSKGIISSLHTPSFDIDEEALEISTGLMAYLAVRRLGAE